MARGRPKKDRIRTNINLEVAIEARLKTLMYDPIKGGFKYGMLSDLINLLLRKWLENLSVQADARAYLRSFGIEIPAAPEQPSTPEETTNDRL
jgi:hypothetical protein